MENEIRFKNINQKILFDLVLLDEIQQGYWENSSPEGHEKPFEFVKTSVDHENPGINFKPLRKYNFAATPILKDRQTEMIWDVRLLNAFGYENPLIDYGCVGFYNCINPDRTGVKFTPLISEHFINLAKEKKFADNEIDFAYFLLEVWYGYTYTKKMLKEDLAEIKLIINGPVVKKQPKQNVPKEKPVDIKLAPEERRLISEEGFKKVDEVKKNIEKPNCCSEEKLEELMLYLDDLRESGVTNMFSAGSYIEKDFGYFSKDAIKILTYWMETFSKRHTTEVKNLEETLNDFIK